MLPFFLQSEIISSKFNVTFSYRYSKKYFEGLSKRIEIDNTIIGLNFPDPLDFSLLPQFIPFIILRFFFLISRLVFIYPILFFEIAYFVILFKKLKLDILHINNGGYPGALSCRAAAIAGGIISIPKIIMVVNNITVEYNSFFRIYGYPIDIITKFFVDKFITGSIVAEKKIKYVLKLGESKSIAIPNGIKPISPNRDKSVILHELNLNEYKGKIIGVVGLLIERKGHLILLQALNMIINEIGVKNIKLIIIGDGPLKYTLNSFIKINNLTDHVCFTGQVIDPINYISVIDFLLLPSLENEDFPFAVIEAMSCSKPVIASKVAGTIEQIVENKNGFLVEPANIVQLADKILILLNDVVFLRNMGKNSLELFLNNFTDQKSLKKYLSIYESN